MVYWTSISVLIPAIFGYKAFSVISSLRENIKVAKSIGLPYVITPWSSWWVLGQVTTKLWKPIFLTFPTAWSESWIDLLPANWAYDSNYSSFSRLGDTYLVISPYSIVLNTASAEVIRQVAHRRENFPKKIETYDILRIFGDNVVTTEGALWRMHRRATAASFNEHNAAIVFREATRQARSMLGSWIAMGPGITIKSLEHDTMRLTLHIISYVGFGLRLLWPGQKPSSGADSSRWTKYGTLEAAAGHTMSFIDAVAAVLDNIFMVLIAPHWLLRLMPLRKPQRVMEAYDNYKQYMDELLEDKYQEIYRGEETDGMDLIGSLAGTTINASSSSSSSHPDAEPAKASSPRPLTKDEIIGNLFIMLIAGHETSANAIHFALIELACRPHTQRRLQHDMDVILGGTDPETWRYEAVVSPLMGSTVGAVMYETMRKMPPVVLIPKGVSPSARTGEPRQVIVADGREYAIPTCVSISMVASASHRNPRYWPHKPSEVTGRAHDLDDWVPERWFEASVGGTAGPSTPSSGNNGGDGGSLPSSDGEGEGPDAGAQLFRPERGAYVPFSEGPRACLGRRIAQVEIIAALAVVLQTHSVELAVDAWATDDEVARMGRDERVALYAKAQARCRETLLTASSILTLKLHGEMVPVRLVPRGEERFVGWMD